MKVIYLKPIGSYKTELRSDTLWGLLCWGLRHLKGKARLEQFIQSYLHGTPELIISSAFPYKQVGKEKIKFFPKPCLKPAMEQQESSSDIREKYRLRKDVKKLFWINETDFAKVLKGEITESHFWERLRNQSDDANAEETPPKKRVETIMHNTIDRIQLSTHNVDMGNDETRGQLYLSDEIHWEDPTNESNEKGNTGLFFLAKGDTSWLLPVLRLYRHLGMGGNRTTGKGFYEVEMDDFSFPNISDANATVNLSLYHPTQDDLEVIQQSAGPLLRYNLEERAGKVGFVKGHLEKSPVIYFREGSVFPAKCFEGKSITGKLYKQEELTQLKFPVYDNGVGFFVNMKVNS